MNGWGRGLGLGWKEQKRMGYGIALGEYGFSG